MKENIYREKALRLENILKNKPWCFDMENDCYIDSDICLGVYTKLLDENVSIDEKEKLLRMAEDIVAKAHYSSLFYQAKMIIKYIYGEDNVPDMIVLTNYCNSLAIALRRGNYEDIHAAALALELEIDRNFKIREKEEYIQKLKRSR